MSQRLQPKFIRAQSAVPRATMRLLFLGEEKVTLLHFKLMVLTHKHQL